VTTCNDAFSGDQLPSGAGHIQHFRLFLSLHHINPWQRKKRQSLTHRIWTPHLHGQISPFPFCLLYSFLKVFSLYFLLLTLWCQNSMHSAKGWDFNSPLITLHVTAWWLQWSFGFLRIPPRDYSRPSAPNSQFQLSDPLSNTVVRVSDHGTVGNTVLHTFLWEKLEHHDCRH